MRGLEWLLTEDFETTTARFRVVVAQAQRATNKKYRRKLEAELDALRERLRDLKRGC